ncbi:MAG TPA: hypothetical protein VFN35_06770, partial [Ktedonobacteraceae bacterium]|nr:hypothetical protein [Ktedonobacteraceae bacterium]
DAISPDGSRVYLLQRLNDGTSHYYVRLYEVDKSALMDGFIIDKNEIDEADMNGTPLARQVAVDGSKVFTLYLDTRHNRAFIHILPLVGDYTGARCIDLPAGKDPGLLHYYTLTLSTYQDGTADLYAANGALGLVTRVKVTPDDQVFNIKADPAVHFTGALSPSGATNRVLSLHNGAILSADGQTLFFIGLQGVWTVNPQKLASDGMEFKRYLMDRTISSLALSPDGKTLYALAADQGILALDVGTGQLRQTFSTPVQSPLGIAWTAG